MNWLRRDTKIVGVSNKYVSVVNFKIREIETTRRRQDID